ncbi:MAG: hypothetical protein IT318_22750 [Anaerolineales bacterium]|nr:hypothetical protein [Anaerolineales bacterium]
MALLNLYSHKKRVDEALTLLQEAKGAFAQAQALDGWTFWFVRLQLERGDFESAHRHLQSSGSESALRDAWAQFYVEQARKLGEPAEAIDYLESAYRETADAAFLVDGYMLMHHLHKWGYVSDHAEEFAQVVGTCASAEVAIAAAFNAHQYELCLRLLNSSIVLFPHQALPNELQHVRIQCFHALGMLSAAIDSAEHLASEGETSSRLLHLAQLYFEKGDLQAMVIVARRLYQREDLSSEEALQLARFARWQDKRLAIELWRRVASSSVPDEVVPSLIALGFQLELDKELKPFMARLPELARKGSANVQAFDVRDFVSTLQGFSEHGQRVQREYLAGKLPIHVMSDVLGPSLIEYLHLQLQDNEAFPNPINNPALFVRHGGRVLPPMANDKPAWRLNIDITAILLANHLGILKMVEDTFAPIRIPANLAPTLHHYKSKIGHHQPSSLSDARKIVEFINRGLIGTFEPSLTLESNDTELIDQLGEKWVATYENAVAQGGYLVSFLPLKKNDASFTPAVINHVASGRLTNNRAVVAALHKHGILSVDAYRKAIDDLGTEGSIQMGVEPPRGAKLFFDFGVLRLLAGTEILPLVAQHYQVSIATSEFRALEAALNWQAGQQVTAEWLDDLLGRLSDGIDSGVYELIPSAGTVEVKSDDEMLQRPSFQPLRTLLSFVPIDGDVIWIDDRYSNGYFTRDTVPIIGVNEVLIALVSAGVLSQAHYFDLLTRLRSGNARYIPIHSSELLYYLEQATVVHGEIRETRELAVLRRYFAACLLQGNLLQKADSSGGAANPDGETAFLIGWHQAIGDALRELWNSDAPNDQREAWSNWILESLYVDHLGVLHLTERHHPELDERYVLGTSLVLLISVALDLLDQPVASASTIRRRYSDWLSTSILADRLEADPLLVSAIAEYLKRYMLAAAQSFSTELPVRVAMAMLQRFYEGLPLSIHDDIGRDAEFISRIGYQRLVVFAGLRFQPDLYWRAMTEVINGREATIVVEIDDHKRDRELKVVTFEPHFQNNPTLPE